MTDQENTDPKTLGDERLKKIEAKSEELLGHYQRFFALPYPFLEFLTAIEKLTECLAKRVVLAEENISEDSLPEYRKQVEGLESAYD